MESEIDDTVAAARRITVRDLFTYCMGFGSVMAAAGTDPIQKYVREYRLGGDGPMVPTDLPGADEWLKRLGSLPLMAQPDERWMYQTSGDALGALVERVSGKRLGQFMKERIFEPLGMKDTGFFVPAEKLEKLPGFYVRETATGEFRFFEDPERSAWRAQLAGDWAGGELVSTVDDYLAFCRMMLNKGRHGRERILARTSVELMTSDQMRPEQRRGAELFFGEHSSWGLGVAVDTARREVYQNPGRFGWTGGFGTTAYTDPKEGLVGILFTQRMMDGPEAPRVFTDFWTLAYGALA